MTNISNKIESLDRKTSHDPDSKMYSNGNGNATKKKATRQRPAALADYPYHLPDKPFPLGKVSYEAFLDWADEDTLAEWVDGEIIMTSPASRKHQEISKFLLGVIDSFVQTYRLGTIIPAPFQMKLPDGGSGREPDLIFVTTEHLGRLQDTYLDGPGDLVVEIVSTESRTRDRVAKFQEYANGGVSEYWIIDSHKKKNKAEFYQLDEQKRYQLIAPDEAGKYHSRVIPNFWLRVDWLWQKPLPAVEQVLREVGGSTYIQHQLKTGGAEYAQQLIEELKKQGFLPPD